MTLKPLKAKSSQRKKLSGGGIENICIQQNIDLRFIQKNKKNLYTIIEEILGIDSNTNSMLEYLKKLSSDSSGPSPYLNIFNDIIDIVKNSPEQNFQSIIYDGNDIFGKYSLWNKEGQREFITMDPTIIQIMIFDGNYDSCIISDPGTPEKTVDIVYSLKLIIRDKNTLYLRYTTQLFPIIIENTINTKKETYKSKIESFDNLEGFNKFNVSLGNSEINKEYDNNFKEFLIKYINFYEFYKKCYTIDNCRDKSITLTDYQLKYISILGKARFRDKNIIYRTSFVSDYVMANLLFASPTYAFISGGYKGFKSQAYGVTRSGYEIAKKYNRPILTIMCKEGEIDSHEFSDAKLIYGEHWGEDTIALSQLTDGAIIIAPFGGWTYIECLSLLANKKIVGIYNDLYNILNYEKLFSDAELSNKDELSKKINKNKSDNVIFFEFALSEQNSIIEYYINYYIILYYIISLDSTDDIPTFENDNFKCSLEYGIKILVYLKKLFITEKEFFKINKYLTNEFISLIINFNKFKEIINTNINRYIGNINSQFLNICTDKEYQSYIPKKCDGIWIKPLFNLIKSTITCDDPFKTYINTRRPTPIKNGGNCDSTTATIDSDLLERLKYIHFTPINKTNNILKNLSNNIIFVFSDVMYLNIYLNKNLNTTTFQLELQEKIKNLTNVLTEKYPRDDDHSTFKGSLKDLTMEEENKVISLDRTIDGVYDRLKHQIVDGLIVRKKYNFIIDDACKDYSITNFVHYPLIRSSGKKNQRDAIEGQLS